MYHQQPDYQITFDVNRPGEYKCEIKAITNYFDHGAEEEENEITRVSLNGIELGLTKDPYCPENGSEPIESSDCSLGELRISQPAEIYTRLGENKRLCHCGIVNMTRTDVDYSQTRVFCSGGHESAKERLEGSTIFVGTKRCIWNSGDSYCTLPDGRFCQIGDADKGECVHCDLSSYIGQDLRACACHVQSADFEWEGDWPPVRAITVCAKVTGLKDCSLDSNSVPKSCNNIPGDDIQDTCPSGNGPPDDGDKVCRESCSQDSECLSGHCTDGMCKDGEERSCDPELDYCNDDCTRNCNAICLGDSQCEEPTACKLTPPDANKKCTCPSGYYCDIRDNAKNVCLEGEEPPPEDDCGNGVCDADEDPVSCSDDCEYYNICEGTDICDFDATWGTRGEVFYLNECDIHKDCQNFEP